MMYDIGDLFHRMFSKVIADEHSRCAFRLPLLIAGNAVVE